LLAFCNPENADLEEFLSRKAWRKICILGGSQVYSYFLEREQIDELYLTIEPKVFGKGISLFDTQVADRRYQLQSFKKLNQEGSLLLHYKKQ
jgi:dihydrofolate reductase